MIRGARRPRGAKRRPWLVAAFGAASLAVAATSSRAPAADEPVSGSRAPDGAAALVVVTRDGLAPARLRVPPATPLVWLNRSPQAALAIAFEDAFPDASGGCGERRGFHAVPGHGPFTLMLVPGTVVALCAPSAPGLYPYAVHGEQSFDGLIEVLDVAGGAGADERSAP